MRTRLAALAIAALISPAQAATLLFFDDFNADVQDDDTDSLLNWTVSSGRVGVHGPGSFDDYPGNGNYIDMDGASANAGKITTRLVLDLVPGLTYTLSFDYGKSSQSFGPERLSFGLGDWSGEIRMTAAPIPAFIRASYDFTVGVSSAPLWFNAFGGDNAGPILDNVNLEVVVPISIPLPPTGTTLLGGIAGLWLIGGRRRPLRRDAPRARPADAR